MSQVRAENEQYQMKITSNISNTTHLPSLFTISIICVTAQSNYHKANCLPIDSSRG